MTTASGGVSVAVDVVVGVVVAVALGVGDGVIVSVGVAEAARVGVGTKWYLTRVSSVRILSSWIRA